MKLLAILILVAIIVGTLSHGWMWVALGLFFWPVIVGGVALAGLSIIAAIAWVLDR